MKHGMERITYDRSIMNKHAFEVGLLEKNRIPGLWVRCDENGYYQIGVEINEEEVLRVADVLEDELIAKIQYWSGKIDDIKSQYG